MSKTAKLSKILCCLLFCAAVFTLTVSFHKFVTGVIVDLNFNEGTGTTAADASGNSHSGTLVNGPTWITGKYGKGINFDGTNDYVNLADHADYTLSPTQNYTWSAWINNSSFKQWSTVWSQTVSNSNFFYFYAHSSTDAEAGPVTNGISVHWYSGTNKLAMHSNNNVLTAGQWSYVTVTYNGSAAQASRFTIYVNGVDVSNRSDVVSSGTIAAIDPTNVRVGSNAPFGEYYPGGIDEVKYYRRLLTVAEIQTDMNAAGSGGSTDTQAPTVSITAPTGGNVAGTINVTANATDNVGVTGVQFLLDGANLGAEDVTAPYSVSWNTTTTTNDNHILMASVRDAAGNATVSAPITVRVLNNNLVAAYGFNENTGTTATDNSGNNNTGTLTNGPTWSASGKFGAAILFDGTNDFVNINDANSLDLTTGMTLEAWVNPSDLTGYKTALCKENGTTNLAYALSPNNNTSGTTNQRPNSRIVGGNTTVTATGTSKLAVNTWTHIASTYDGSVLRFYINGVQVATGNAGGSMTTTTNALRIGGSTALGEYFTGLIDEVRIYNRALSQTEIQTDMNTPVAPDVTNPTVNITAPATGNVSGTVNVTATASDNIAVVGVQFLLDGVNLGAEDLTAPYSVSWNTATATSVNHTLTARARDAAGNIATSAGVVVTPVNDNAAPTVNITTPAPGSTISGTISINAAASDDVGVVGVEFRLDNVKIGSEVLTPPYSVSLNTATTANGVHAFIAIARDAAGNATSSTGVTVTVDNQDVTKPTATITAPAGGNVSGTVNITANASDNIGVAGVQFLLDGVNLGAEDLTAPYSVSWNTATAGNGTHTLTARARDATGNTGVSANVVVNVTNDVTPPTINITAPVPGNVAGVVSITANATDNVSVTGVQFLLDGVNLGAEDLTAPYTLSWNSATVANGEHILTAKARDASGNIGFSAEVDITVTNDVTAPAIIMTAPAAGTVSGTITVSADASDDVDVVGVQFLLDGVNLGTEDLTDPYSVSWNTTTVTNGNHILTARARDAAGNSKVSANLVVNVVNDAGPPVVNITTPSAGTVVGTITVTASATDDLGVAGVQFLLDGVNLSTEDVSAPYSISWNTTTIANGSHLLSAKARDAAGNTTISSSIQVSVNNTVTGNSNALASLTFNEGTGTSASDNSGNNHNGTLSGATWTTGKYGQAVNLNGTSNYVNIPDHADFTLNPAQSYTWSAWVKNTNFNQWSTLWSQTVSNSNFFYFYAHSSTDGESGPVTNGISVHWYTGTNKLAMHSNNNVLTAGQWSYVTVTYDGSAAQASRLTIYVNGVDVSNRSDVVSSGTIATIDPTNIRIGSNAPFGEYLNAAVDEVKYYNRALSATEIQNDMNSGSSVDNTAPTVSISSPTNNSTVSGTINVNATAADNVGVAGVQFLLDNVAIGAEDLTAPYSISLNTATIPNGTHTLVAKARDAAGNSTTSTGVVITVNNVTDTDPPAVSITSPAAGQVVGTITITASAGDDVGVAGVQFLLDGVNLGAEDVAAPYSVSWNTAGGSNGNHTLTAKARDAAGHVTTSAAVIVTVNNFIDTVNPTVTVTSPTGGVVSGTINITANANDNVGVAGVQFLIDGNNLGAEDVTAPFSFSWNSGLNVNGNHTLSARARDAAGNTAVSGTVTVTVNNTNAPVISGVTVSAITSSSAVISWTTNVPASSQVNYGTTASYGNSTLLDGNLVTSHSQTLTSLSPGTQYHYQVLSADANSILATSADATFNTANLAASLGTLNGHNVLADNTGKIVPWTTNPGFGYDTVVYLAWDYLLHKVPNDPATSKPAYYSQSYMNPNTQVVSGWPHNPAGLYGMMVESAQKYYLYSGNASVMQIAENVALWHLDHGMTNPTDSWASVPYASANAASLTYNGANVGNGIGDGTGYIEPDKIGELGYAWLQLYKYDGNIRFRDAAIQAGNVLSSKIRAGTVSSSPWPYRVNAQNNSVRDDYSADVIGPISLLDDLIANGWGDTAAYRVARTTAWNWMMTYPMSNNNWAQYFEDVNSQPSYNNNLNQYIPMMTARYLIFHPEMDANWLTHVKGLISFVESKFSSPSFGATAINEQTTFYYIMGSHTSRYASINALLYEKTGDAAAKEKAYRSFNWATYMARSTGVIIDGPSVNNEWFTDGYADYVRHFMTGMAAVPEWSPATQTHLLRSSSVVKNVTYSDGSISYTTYDGTSTDILHLNFNPASVTVDGVPLSQRSDLTQPGWTLDIATKTLRIYHTNGTQISVNAVPPFMP